SAARIPAPAREDFLPELNEGALYLTFTLPSNTALNEGRRIEPMLSEIIDRFPQGESRMSQLRRAAAGTDPTLPNNLAFFVKLRPMTEWPKSTPTLESLM